MKKFLNLLFPLIIGLIIFSFPLTISGRIPPKPLWAIKGVKHLNDHRINKDYEFVAFHHELTDQNIIPDDSIAILRLNMAEYFNVNPDQISIESIDDTNLSRLTYIISFPSIDKEEITRVYVQPVDSYQKYNNNIDGSFDYKLDELYAISEKDVTPHFDNFKLTRSYGVKPVFMSLIPGLGQIYKGQPVKGYSLLGAEVVLCSTIAVGELNRSYYLKKARKNQGNYESWKSKASFYRSLRDIGIVLASATYLYNLIDAAFVKGAPRILISRQNSYPADIVFTPVASPDHIGLGLSLTF